VATVYPTMDQDQSQNDAGGLAAVFATQRSQLLHFLVARCGDATEAEDLLQDLWIRLSAIQAGPIGNPRAYLFRMANNLALNRSRARRRAMIRDRSWLAADGCDDVAPEDRHDPALPADELLARQQEAELLHRSIAALPPGAQRALRLHRLEGHEQKEVARIMGISRSGVEKHLALAMRHLRDALAECGWFVPAVSRERQRAAAGSRERENDDGA
jgi:RNA polymerase sigma-70 factor (ECF subfamily)